MYGFKDISHPGCNLALTNDTSLFCSAATLVEAGADHTYKFADVVHPTTAYSKLIGEYVLSEMAK